MRNVRLNPIIISIIGAVLCVLAPALIWYFLIQPVNAEIATENAALEPVHQYVGVSNPPDLIAANQSLAAAEAKATVIRAQWATIQVTKNPLIQSADKWRAWYQWIGFLEFEFAQDINGFLSKAPAQPLSVVSAPTPPNSPDGVPQGIVAMPLGTISVFGSYNQIVQSVERWNKFHRIVVVDGLSLQGYSPFMTGSYNATEYIYTESASGLPSTAPGGTLTAAAATSTGTVAGGPAAPGGFGAPGAPGAPSGMGAPGGMGGRGGFGAPGGMGAPGYGGAQAGTALPPPPSVPTNFEDTPEYRVHLHSPVGTTNAAGNASGFTGGNSPAFNFRRRR